MDEATFPGHAAETGFWLSGFSAASTISFHHGAWSVCFLLVIIPWLLGVCMLDSGIQLSGVITRTHVVAMIIQYLIADQPLRDIEAN